MPEGNVVIIVQARMSSRRLPGKTLAPIAGAPMLARMMERVARSQLAHAAIVATSIDPSDDCIAQLCRERGIGVSRGPLDDVLARFVEAVPDTADAVVRLTADCPFIDPGIIDRHIEAYAEAGEGDYVTNAIQRTFPDGLDVEVFGAQRLREASRKATSDYDREHVTPWIRRNARLVAITQRQDLSDLRWTVDTADDLCWARAVYDRIYGDNTAFTARDVYALLAAEPRWIRESESSSTTGWGSLLARQLEEHVA